MPTQSLTPVTRHGSHSPGEEPGSGKGYVIPSMANTGFRLQSIRLWRIQLEDILCVFCLSFLSPVPPPPQCLGLTSIACFSQGPSFCIWQFARKKQMQEGGE